MQVDGQNAVSTGMGDEVRHQLGGDRRAGAGLPVLAGIAEIGEHRGDAPGRCAPQRIDHDQQFHQMIVGGIARRLDDEHVLPADVFLDLDEHFHVGEAAHHGLGQRKLEILGDGLGQRAVGVARQKPHAPRPVFVAHARPAPSQ